MRPLPTMSVEAPGGSMTVTKPSLLRTTATAALAAFAAVAVPTAFAEETSQQAQAPQSSAEARIVLEEIIVTGTRMESRYSQPNPVIAVSAGAIEYAGATTLTEFLEEIPALANSSGLQDRANIAEFSRAGLSRLNLRNLGEGRTLTLVNGRRHVAAATDNAGVDVNTIPVSLVERVEVLTGGASAVYGADGVSGVVNFILKKDFEGLDARFQSGVTEHGAENLFGSVLFGNKFAAERGNFTIGGEFSTIDPVQRDQRSYTALGRRLTLIGNPAEVASGSDDPNVPDNIFARDARFFDTSAAGAVFTDFDFGNNDSGIDFNGDGRPWDPGIFDGNFSQTGGSGTPRESYVRNIIPGLDRHALNGTFRFEIAEGHRFFAEGKFARTEAQFESQPMFSFGYRVRGENPFIPDAIRAAASGPDGLLGPDGIGVIFVSRDDFELGFATADIERDTYRSAVGFEGSLSDNIRYETSYVYGRTEETNRRINDRIEERWRAAIDAVRDPATGNIVCRSSLDPTAIPPQTRANLFGLTFTPGPDSGCVPANIFGAGQVSSAVRDWVNVTTVNEALLQQHALTSFVSGDTAGWFSLPGGPVSFAAGAEYRKEESEFSPDRLRQQLADILVDPPANIPGGFTITHSGPATRTQGDYDVKEVFAELSLPLLRDLPLMELLTVSGAYRYSDYSTSGGTNTWNVGSQWRINDSVMLRGTRARAVRAPNVQELFQPQTQTRAGLDDPCDANNVGLGRDPATRLANCQAALASLGLDPLTFNGASSFAVTGLTGGNPDLEPEKGDTWTAGVVLTPTFAPGLAIGFDYYDITLLDAINAFSPQTVVENCFDLSQPNPFCQNLTRSSEPLTLGQIASFQTLRLNVASFETSGFDISVQYDLDPARLGVDGNIGRFEFALLGNRLEKLEFFEVEGQTPDSDLGEEGAPEWQATFDATWLYNNFMLNYAFTWTDNAIRFPDTYETQPDFVEDRYKFYSERFTQDIQVRYDLGKLELYAGVNNFTDQKPDLGSLTAPVGALGRFFYAAASVKLGGADRR